MKQRERAKGEEDDPFRDGLCNLTKILEWMLLYHVSIKWIKAAVYWEEWNQIKKGSQDYGL